MSYAKLGTDQDGNKIEVFVKDRLNQMYIIGNTGMGKSVLIENLVMQDIAQGLGICVLDPLGNLIDRIVSRIDRRLEDVILADLKAVETPFGLNLYESSKDNNIAIERIMHVWNKLFGIDRETPLLSDYMYNCAATILANPGFSMIEIPRLLQDKAFRDELLQKVTVSSVKDFWISFERLSPHDRTNEIRVVMRRVREFMTPTIQNIVGQAHTTIDLTQVMDTGKILLVRLDRESPNASNLIGSLCVALLLQAAFARKTTRQFHIYCDEFDRFATQDFKDLYDQARQFGVGIAIAHQTRAKIHEEVPELARNVLQAATTVCFQLTPVDAGEMVEKFDTTPPVSLETKREAVLTYNPDVIGHVRSHGHTNKDVTKFISTYISPLTLESQKHAENPLSYRAPRIANIVYPSVTFPQGDVYAFIPETLRKHLQNLNDYLFNHMAQTGKYSPIGTLYHQPSEMIKAFSYVFGFPHYYLGHYYPVRMEAISALKRKQELEADLLKYLTSPDRSQANAEAYRKADQKRDAENPALEKVLRAESGKLISEDLLFQLSHNLPIGTQNELYGNRLVSYRYEGGSFTDDDNSYPEIAYDVYYREERRYRDFMDALVMASYFLREEPIYTESGRFEEKQGIRQTPDQVRDAITNELTHLDTLHARVRLKTQPSNIKTKVCHRCGKVNTLSDALCASCGVLLRPEYLITIEIPNTPPSPLESRRKAIVENNLKQGYVVARSAVEAAIVARQRAQPQEPQKPKQQPPQEPPMSKPPKKPF